MFAIETIINYYHKKIKKKCVLKNLFNLFFFLQSKDCISILMMFVFLL